MTALLPLSSFDQILGPIVIGSLISTAIWGITCVQTYSFFTGHSMDTRVFKASIVFLWLLDTTDTIFICHVIYYYCVTSFLNPIAVVVPIWSAIVHVAVTCLSNFIVRGMFTVRIYHLSSRNLMITSLIMIVSLLSLVSGFILTVKGFLIPTYFELGLLSIYIYLAFAAGAASDLCVAGIQCVLLYRSRTGIKRTNSLISTLIIYSVNTGLIVTIDSFSVLITYIVMPTNLIFLGLYFPMSKLYLNSYLAVLNARQGLRDELDNRSPFPLPIISAGGIGSQTPSHRTVPLNQSLFMQDQYSGLIPTHDHPPHGVSISVETISDRSRIGDKDSELAKKSR